MKKTRIAAFGAAAAVAVVSALVSAGPAFAEYRQYPGVNCEGYAYTYAKTAANYDQSVISKYNSTSYDQANWGPNATGAIQVHNNWTGYHRSSVAQIQTSSGHYYISASHSCDN